MGEKCPLAASFLFFGSSHYCFLLFCGSQPLLLGLHAPGAFINCSLKNQIHNHLKLIPFQICEIYLNLINSCGYEDICITPYHLEWP